MSTYRLVVDVYSVKTTWKIGTPEDLRCTRPSGRPANQKTYLVTAADQKLQAFWKRGKPGDLLSRNHLEYWQARRCNSKPPGRLVNQEITASNLKKEWQTRISPSFSQPPTRPMNQNQKMTDSNPVKNC